MRRVASVVGHVFVRRTTAAPARPPAYAPQMTVEMLHCHHCGDAIGVYEPLIAVVEGQPLETSRAANGHPDTLAATCYHRDCFMRAEAQALSLPA
jgi:hypothetical protein